jgi:hypothetical protein
MTLPDYRIKFPAPLIDFSADVGLTGQAHDEYPAPGTQARYDHLRLYLIGLLTHQASYLSPFEYSEGTIWFDLNTTALKTYFNNQWQEIANAIILTSEGQTVTLADWYTNQATIILKSLAPEVVFGGRSTISGIFRIPIPSNVYPYIFSDSRIFMTVNSLHNLDPREVAIVTVGSQKFIDISPNELDANDLFYVSIRRIPNATFSTENIII